MKHFLGLVTTLAACSAVLFGTGADWQAFVTSVPDSVPGAVVPIDLSSYLQGDFVGVDYDPTSIAITPDGKRALVTIYDSLEVAVLDLSASPITTSTVSMASVGAPINIAITPDGTRAVVVCVPASSKASVIDSLSIVAVLDLTTNPVTLEPSVVEVDGGIFVAITPDGKRAIVVPGDQSQSTVLTVLDLTTTPISIETNMVTGIFFGGIAITPNGKRALGVVGPLNAVTVLNLTKKPNPEQVHTITVSLSPINVAITPNGKRALVICGTSSSGALPALIASVQPGITVLNLTTTPISVENLLIPLSIAPTAIAITPDGKRAVVTGIAPQRAGEQGAAPRRSQGPTVVVFDLTTSPISQITTPPMVIPAPTDVAISPDQAPTARFTMKRDGKKVTFDASSSTSPVGAIARYTWKFGDGHKAKTRSPIITHKYHNLDGKKPIIVKLTVTNTAGTSTKITFTGRTVYNHGGPSAVCRQPLIMP